MKKNTPNWGVYIFPTISNSDKCGTNHIHSHRRVLLYY